MLSYTAVLRRTARDPLALWFILAFPGVFLNLVNGQNGLLMSALLGGCLLLLDRGAPWSGGLLLGAASFKPHLAIFFILSLAAGRNWQALAGALIAAICLAALSLAVFGTQPWAVFLDNLAYHLKAFETRAMPLHKTASVFGQALFLGLSYRAAVALQTLVMAGVALAVTWAWAKTPSPCDRVPLTVVGALLFTPYSFYYDLALVAVALAWLDREVEPCGWRIGEKCLFWGGWLLPLFVYPLGQGRLGLPIGSIGLCLLFLGFLRRCVLGDRADKAPLGRP